MADDFDIKRLDEVIHGRVRLGIMAVLSSADSADFNTLKARLQTTDGNLSVHLRKLEDAGFVAVTKRFEGRKPLTEASMTAEGRRAFVAYLDAMQGLVGPR
ncbi:winged helix-turn-helix domain-containing protein [Brevundimonas sp.]|uniref:winged helix-turn-helix domain-containing protein n=1 Tax=Brevundimonas sp. TaxID=1871086 RepID=UPI00356A9A72